MQVQTKFFWLSTPVALGDHIDGGRVCWVGGWDRCKVFFVVMVVQEYTASPRSRPALNSVNNQCTNPRRGVRLPRPAGPLLS